MSHLLVTGPEREPVSLQQFQNFLRLNEGDSELLNSLITAARMTIEAQSGLRLITQSWQIFLDAWPAEVYELPIWPVQEITSVGATGSRQVTISPVYYELIKQGRPALLSFSGVDLPTPARARAGVQITLTAGFGDHPDDVPENLIQAVLSLAAHWFDIDDWNQYGVDNAIPPNVYALIAPYRLKRL